MGQFPLTSLEVPGFCNVCDCPHFISPESRAPVTEFEAVHVGRVVRAGNHHSALDPKVNLAPIEHGGSNQSHVNNVEAR